MIDVALSPAEISRLSETDLGETCVVVFDVLRATSSMITGLAHGVAGFIPVKTVEVAWALKKQNPNLLLAGERHGVPPPGFDLGNSPAEFTKVSGRQIIITTTNGTVALQQVRTARTVLLGALLNIGVLAQLLQSISPAHLLLVCAGTGDRFSVEDAIGAGALLASLQRTDYSDAASMINALYQHVCTDLHKCLRSSQNGRALLEIGKEEDVWHCSQLSIYDVIGILQGEAVVQAELTA
jgi:2-phosphosulfolactate phosphatase